MDERVAALEATVKAMEANRLEFQRDMKERFNRLEVWLAGLVAGMLTLVVKTLLEMMGK